MTDAAGAAERAASSFGDSINLAAAKPVADIAMTPMATPARKKREPGPPYNPLTPHHPGAGYHDRPQ